MDVNAEHQIIGDEGAKRIAKLPLLEEVNLSNIFCQHS